MSELISMTGKVALVTGGASGIGREVCKILGELGARVFVADRNETGAAETAQMIGDAATPIVLDVVDEDRWQAVVGEIEASAGKLDVLVNAAGITGFGRPQDPENIDMDDWRGIQRINVEGTVIGCKTAIPAMRRAGGGSIVNLASIASVTSTPVNAPYGASKAAIKHYTTSVASWCGDQGYNIRCNSVLPGMIETPLIASAPPERRKAWHESTPMHRDGQPDEVARAIVFLCSDAASFITGTGLNVDGGVHERPAVW
jgi:3(or 17)beta-hydroxysteroid dehydrogenase